MYCFAADMKTVLSDTSSSLPKHLNIIPEMLIFNQNKKKKERKNDQEKKTKLNLRHQ